MDIQIGVAFLIILRCVWRQHISSNFVKNSFKNTIRGSNSMDPDEARHCRA